MNIEDNYAWIAAQRKNVIPPRVNESCIFSCRRNHELFYTTIKIHMDTYCKHFHVEMVSLFSCLHVQDDDPFGNFSFSRQSLCFSKRFFFIFSFYFNFHRNCLYI